MQHSQQDATFRFLWSYCSLHIRNVTLRKKGDDVYFSSEYDQSINSQKSVLISLSPVLQVLSFHLVKCVQELSSLHSAHQEY